MVNHELKTWRSYFHAIADGTKTFEIRRDDRGFRVGDTLRLRETEYGSGNYTGREERRVITQILRHEEGLGLIDGFAILSVVRINMRRPALSQGAADLLARLRSIRSRDEWFPFINAGFKMVHAETLKERGFIEMSEQLGMPAVRILWSPSNRCDECDNGIRADWDYCAWCGSHLVNKAGN